MLPLVIVSSKYPHSWDTARTEKDINFVLFVSEWNCQKHFISSYLCRHKQLIFSWWMCFCDRVQQSFGNQTSPRSHDIRGLNPDFAQFTWNAQGPFCFSFNPFSFQRGSYFYLFNWTLVLSFYFLTLLLGEIYKSKHKRIPLKIISVWFISVSIFKYSLNTALLR